MSKCKKCDRNFEPKKGLKNYCSLKCRNARVWNESDKKIKSNSAKLRYELNPLTQNKLNLKCKVCNKDFKKYSFSLFCSRDCYLEAFKKGLAKITSGGYRKNSGRGKYGWFNGYWCQSSWELAWVIYNLDHGIKFERNKKGFQYIFENKKYKFYPDFKIGSIYYEIKGFTDKKTEEKIKQFPFSLKVLYKVDLQNVFNYVETFYGSNFINLYST